MSPAGFRLLASAKLSGRAYCAIRTSSLTRSVKKNGSELYDSRTNPLLLDHRAGVIDSVWVLA
jgi:hypothetical protein